MNILSSITNYFNGNSLVLIGLMGSGKTSIGQKLAKALTLPFSDSDHEIAIAAGCSIEDFFVQYGEPAFREGEAKVIKRLLNGTSKVIATGGGAYMCPVVREKIKEKGISVWLRADLEVLLERTSRRSERPLLKTKNPRATLKELMDLRYPIYAQADIVVESDHECIDITIDSIIESLQIFLSKTQKLNNTN